MNARNTKGTPKGLATGIMAAAVVVVVGTLAAVWHPLHESGQAPLVSNAATTSSSRTPDMSVYLPSRFAAPENIETQAPTF